MPSSTATRVRVVPPAVGYTERMLKLLADFYEVPCPQLVVHPKFPVITRINALATYHRQAGVPTVTLYHDHHLTDTVCHEFTHYLDDLQGLGKCRGTYHDPDFKRRMSVVRQALTDALELERAGA